eukprot:TRINITY_DN434_c0_g1_i1.p4 TRINITY_DN434_c0_g1~~TRINITY_DN434_c0_g1_i1.p4  ORF type:complete len:280 (-),score=34.86 TRINITY_DN434_c0_g1_i1:304-1143(-)
MRAHGDQLHKQGNIIKGEKTFQSLLVLSTIIQRLSKRSKKNSNWIPYRDSKLTRYMQKALEGTSKISILATISQSVQCYDESINTINFATRAKRIVQVVPRNKAPPLIDPAIKQAYEAKIMELEKRIRMMESCRSEEIPQMETVGSEAILDLPEYIEKDNKEAEELKSRVEFLDKELMRVNQEKEELQKELERIKKRPTLDLTPEMEEKLKEQVIEEVVEESENLCDENLELEELAEEKHTKDVDYYKGHITVYSYKQPLKGTEQREEDTRDSESVSFV